VENPVRPQIGALDLNSDVGWQEYRGLKLAARHRTTDGVSLNASYTLSKCEGTATALASATFNQISAGYTDPDNPDFDAGYCDQDRTHLGTVNMGYQTPDVGNGVVRALASNWRLSGILSARSGNWLNITSGVDRALIGSHSSVRQTSSAMTSTVLRTPDLEPGQQIDNYFNRAAFALAPLSTLGTPAPR
jgi:hypothetical protein